MISVVVPTRGGSCLEDCLKSLKQQGRRPSEIITVFDSTNPGNTGIAKKYSARIFFDRHGTIGGAYATGVKASRGDIIAFLDDDCVAPNDWIERLEKEFKEGVDVVCGDDVLPEKSPFFETAVYQIDKARTMKKAVYGLEAKNRLRAANIAYRRRVFEKENFNPNLKGLQEPEFHHRLFKKGFRMKFNPNIRVYHRRRSSLGGVFYQIYRNGKAKIDILKLHKDMLAAYDVLPFAYLFLLLFSIFMPLGGNFRYLQTLLIVTAAYFLLKPLTYLSKIKDLQYYPLLLPIVFVREVAYSLGIIAGLKNIFRR